MFIMDRRAPSAALKELRNANIYLIFAKKSVFIVLPYISFANFAKNSVHLQPFRSTHGTDAKNIRKR